MFVCLQMDAKQCFGTTKLDCSIAYNWALQCNIIIWCLFRNQLTSKSKALLTIIIKPLSLPYQIEHWRIIASSGLLFGVE